MLCDSNIERHIRKNNYEDLNRRSPLERFVEKFKLETKALELDLKQTDEVVGWFHFDKKCDKTVAFADEIPTPKTQDIIMSHSNAWEW